MDDRGPKGACVSVGRGRARGRGAKQQRVQSCQDTAQITTLSRWSGCNEQQRISIGVPGAGPAAMIIGQRCLNYALGGFRCRRMKMK